MTGLHIILLLGFALGHVFLTTSALNVLYGEPWKRWILKCGRAFHDLWILIGLPWLSWVLIQHWTTSELWWPSPPLLTTYCWIAFLSGVVGFPYSVLTRMCRPAPSMHVSRSGTVIDVAQQLGEKPIGRGDKWFFAHFPFNQQFSLEIVERAYCHPSVPKEWNGLSILHFSDFHFTGSVRRDYFDRVVDHANALECDIVALTGDLIDRPQCYPWVADLFGRIEHRLGRFAILGNHDAWFDHQKLREDLTQAGWTVLSGRWEVLEHAGRKMAVAGTEYPWMGRLPEIQPIPEDTFRFVLSHTPDNFPWACRHGADLVVAGHNHGGQVRLPLIGPVFMPSRYGRWFDMGSFQRGRTLMHVSRGVSGKHPLRIGCRPEITKIVLHSSDDR